MRCPIKAFLQVLLPGSIFTTMLNPLPHMTILGSFNSAANKNVMSKI